MKNFALVLWIQSRIQSWAKPNQVWGLAMLAGIATLAFRIGPSTPDVAPAPDEPPLLVKPASFENVAADSPEYIPLPSVSEAYAAAGIAIDGRDAVARVLKLIAAGCERLETVPDYTTTFLKQERIDGTLSEVETIDLKLRHKPFSIYMNWSDGPEKGREILFAEGKNDGEMLFHAGGWKGRLVPAIKLNPTGRLAMAHSRYPVTDVGLVATGRRTIARRSKQLSRTGSYRFHIEENSDFNGRACLFCALEFDQKDESEVHRKSYFWIDREHLVPIAFMNYGWPEPEAASLTGDALDAETLLENYTYANIRLQSRLADADFDAGNGEYRFRR